MEERVKSEIQLSEVTDRKCQSFFSEFFKNCERLRNTDSNFYPLIRGLIRYKKTFPKCSLSGKYRSWNDLLNIVSYSFATHETDENLSFGKEDCFWHKVGA